jgi:hypothetical protein
MSSPAVESKFPRTAPVVRSFMSLRRVVVPAHPYRGAVPAPVVAGRARTAVRLGFRLLLLAGVLCSLQAVPLHAAQWYVATTGADGNAGTSSSPKRTLQGALSISTLKPGDTINVGPGTFAGTANTVIAGTSGSPITIVGSGINITLLTDKVTVDENYYTIRNLTMVGGGITVESPASWVIVDGVESYRAINPVWFKPGTSNCQLINSIVRSGGANSVFNVGGSGHLIATNHFSNNNGWDVHRINNLENTIFRANTYDGIRSSQNEITSSATATTIGTGTKVFTVGAGLTAYYVDNYIEVESVANTANYLRGWVVSYSGTTLTLDVTTTGGSGTFSDWRIRPFAGANHADIWQYFATGAGWFTRNIVWEQNIIKNGSSQILNGESSLIPNDFHNHVFRNNLILNNRLYWNNSASNCFIYNNTIYNVELAQAFQNPAPRDTEFQGTMYVYNNIFSRIGASKSGGVYTGTSVNGAADYNLITDYDDTVKTGYSEPNGINGGYTPSQIFVDPEAGDFRLRAGSPAIGRGVDLSVSGLIPGVTGSLTDITGTLRTGAWDMGAYQYGSSTPAPAPTLSASAAPTTIVAGQSSTITWSSANASSVSISGLGVVALSGSRSVSPAATTTYTVTATGLGGVVASDVTVVVSGGGTPTAGDGTWIEAENGVVSAPFTVANGMVSQSVQTATLTGSGRLAIRFNVMEPGDYAVVAQVEAPSEGANSLFFNINAEPADPYDVWDIPVTTGVQTRLGAWRGNGSIDQPEFALKYFTLAAGIHELIIRGREANVRLDKVMISKRPGSTRGVALQSTP